MIYAILGIALLAVLLLALRWFVKADPARITGALTIAAAVLVAGFAIALIAVGRVGLGLSLAAFAILAYLRWRRRLGLAYPGGGAPGGAGATRGGTSGVDTGYFAMTLDHETGSLDGEVRRGRHRGHMLSSLALPALVELLDECRDDPASLQVLSAYLDRHHAEWRETAGASGAAGAAGDGADGPALSRDEAFRILGLEPGADEAAIREAHRRLMLKFHPDQGGSAWFAARINEARDLLIGR